MNRSHFPPQTVLLQLQENQRLRLEVFRLRTEAKENQNCYLSNLQHQQMQIEKITTQLKMFVRRGHQQHTSSEEESVSNLIANCLLDLETLAETASSLKCECQTREERRENSAEGQNQALFMQLTQKLQEAQSTIEYLGEERAKLSEALKTAENALNSHVKTIQSQSKELVEQGSELKSQKQQYRQMMAQLQSLNQSYQAVSKENQDLSNKLRQVQQGSSKYVDYIRKKAGEIELQNQKLVMKQREAVCRQTELTRLVEEREEKITRLQEEVGRVKREMLGYQHQFREIIEQQQKIKSLQRERNRKQQEVETRKQIKEVMRDATTKYTNCRCQDSRTESANGECGRKFNLQAFQEKISQSQTSETQ